MGGRGSQRLNVNLIFVQQRSIFIFPPLVTKRIHLNNKKGEARGWKTPTTSPKSHRLAGAVCPLEAHGAPSHTGGGRLPWPENQQKLMPTGNMSGETGTYLSREVLSPAVRSAEYSQGDTYFAEKRHRCSRCHTRRDRCRRFLATLPPPRRPARGGDLPELPELPELPKLPRRPAEAGATCDNPPNRRALSLSARSRVGR